MRYFLLFTALVLASGRLLAQEEAPPARQPVPAPAKIDEARKSLHEVYARELAAAKTMAQKAALAQQWLLTAESSKDNPAERYVLWQEAAELGAQAGAANTVGTALGALATHFQTDVTDLAVTHFGRLQKQLKTKPEAYELASQASPFAERALELDLFEPGEELAQIAAAAAKKSGDELAIVMTAGRAADAKELAQEHAKIQPALQTLKTRPADPTANLAVGRFQCFYKNRWDLGLPMLALGEDAALQKLAESELRAGDKSSLALADAWWKLAEERTSEQMPLQFRAVWHYERVATELDGLARRRVGKAMTDFWTKYPELFFRREVRGSHALPDHWQIASREPVITLPLQNHQRAWVTHPFGQKRPATLTRTTWLPLKPTCVLTLEVSSHSAANDWMLEVKVNDKVALTKLIQGGKWETQRVDLAPYAGQEVTLLLSNRTGGKKVWFGERGYWDNVAIVPK